MNFPVSCLDRRLQIQYKKYWPLKYERKPELRTLESGITESLESGIHRLGIRNPTVGIRNPRLAWIPLHGAIIKHRLFFPLLSRSIPRSIECARHTVI